MRRRRKYSETGLYHIVIRGVNKQNIFFDKEDKVFFLGLVRKYSRKFNIKVHAYCLMDNHVHLQLEDEDKNISIFMQSLCSLYARVFNKKYDRIGHLFQERFASEVILDKSYFLTVFRYILQNPVKAGICNDCKYMWSSYFAYKKDKTFVYKKLLLEYLGNINNLYDFLKIETGITCLEIELRPSEKVNFYIETVKKILKTNNPIIKPDLPSEILLNKIKSLKKAGLSIRIISRITGINKNIVSKA